MSNTITIKDPNGNIVCSVENMGAVKSEEGVLKEIVTDSGILMGTIFFTAIGAVGINAIKNKIDARKAEKAKAILEQNKQAILNSPQYKEIVNRTNNIAKVLSKTTADFNTYFKRELDKLAKTNQIIEKYKQNILKGLWKPYSEEDIKTEISKVVLSIYLGKDEIINKNYAFLHAYIFDYEATGVEKTDDWDDIRPVIDHLIYEFKFPNGGVFDKISLYFLHDGDLRMISCDIISLFSDIRINVDQINK